MDPSPLRRVTLPSLSSRRIRPSPVSATIFPRTCSIRMRPSPVRTSRSESRGTRSVKSARMSMPKPLVAGGRERSTIRISSPVCAVSIWMRSSNARAASGSTERPLFFTTASTRSVSEPVISTEPRSRRIEIDGLAPDWVSRWNSDTDVSSASSKSQPATRPQTNNKRPSGGRITTRALQSLRRRSSYQS